MTYKYFVSGLILLVKPYEWQSVCFSYFLMFSSRICIAMQVPGKLVYIYIYIDQDHITKEKIMLTLVSTQRKHVYKKVG
jgi:hypothetical protein